VPIAVKERRKLEDGLAMFYLGGTRSASALLKAQSETSSNNAQAIETLKQMTRQAYDLHKAIYADVDVLGDFLHEGWERKRSLSPQISNQTIDDVYARARAAGATGGKLLGAGGAGFLLVYAPNGARESVIEALRQYPFHRVEIDTAGASIIYAD
jgi:D-glycero-alpha-D-manno-heptose-7-phosphate kinase